MGKTDMPTRRVLVAAYDAAQTNNIPDAVIYGERSLTDVEEVEIHRAAINEVACDFDISESEVEAALQ